MTMKSDANMVQPSEPVLRGECGATSAPKPPAKAAPVLSTFMGLGPLARAVTCSSLMAPLAASRNTLGHAQQADGRGTVAAAAQGGRRRRQRQETRRLRSKVQQLRGTSGADWSGAARANGEGSAGRAATPLALPPVSGARLKRRAQTSVCERTDFAAPPPECEHLTPTTSHQPLAPLTRRVPPPRSTLRRLIRRQPGDSQERPGETSWAPQAGPAAQTHRTPDDKTPASDPWASPPECRNLDAAAPCQRLPAPARPASSRSAISDPVRYDSRLLGAGLVP
ncbi:hypothetical protein SVAN01_05102 [Stagonosporopsis vannaccii]|nr:hypothetical protein SVAN01_05102 [Stagonosporopsis vannaccii]